MKLKSPDMTAKSGANPLLTDGMGIGEAVFLILHADLVAFLDAQKLTLESDDPESVHQMRVANRRIRAALDIFKAFPPRAVVAFDSELRWIFSKLGAVRDLDVEIENMNLWMVDEKVSPIAGQEFVGKLQEERQGARVALVRALKSERFDKLAEGMAAELSAGPTSKRGLTSVPVLAVAPDLIRKAYKKAAKAASALQHGSPSVEFHGMRKKAKKLRYALEFFADIYGDETKEMVKRLKEVQDVLGSRQDDVIARNHLKELAEKNGLAKEAKALVRKIDKRYKADAASCEDKFESLEKEVFGKSWKSLSKAMQRRRRDLWRA